MNKLHSGLLTLALIFAMAISASSGQYKFDEYSFIGNGLVSELNNLTGSDFELAYMQSMYKQNVKIGTLALLGSQQASTRQMRVFSAKILSERTDMNHDLSSWCREFMNKIMLPVSVNDFSQLQAALSKCCGSDFDCFYISTMICLMKQSKDAADLAMQRTQIPQIYQQARVVARTNSNEIQAFEQWKSTCCCS